MATVQMMASMMLKNGKIKHNYPKLKTRIQKI